MGALHPPPGHGVGHGILLRRVSASTPPGLLTFLAAGEEGRAGAIRKRGTA